MQTNVVLPPIGPLFANAAGAATFGARQTATATASTPGSVNQSPPHPGSETPQHAALALLLCEKSLRTPTSGHAHAYANGTFPSSSPIKKDSLSSIAAPSLLTTPKTNALTSATASSCTAKHSSASMLVLSLDSPKASPSASSSPLPHDDGSASPTCEDEKLRLSRERNRLHAQRTRIRKRELLESLKERIHALQSEHGLLKQAFEFHATAVCLLSLGTNGACDDPSIKHLEEVSDAALELFNTTSSTIHACVDDDDEDLLLLDESSEASSGASAPVVVHDKSCEWYDDDDEHESGESASCTCRSALEPQHAHDQLLNSNGKRAHPTSTALSLAGSKEEREQLRRERNRLHARRARLRKKLVLERSQQAVQELRKRNEYLRERLAVLITSIYGASAATLATKPELSSLS